MEVSNTNFRKMLYSILQNIEKASIVTFDLEMTSIHMNGNNFSDYVPTRPSLQQLYHQIKLAAQTYQVVQFGMTLLEEQKNNGTCLSTVTFLLQQLSYFQTYSGPLYRTERNRLLSC